MSERAAPFYCPYCGDEDLRPSGAETARGEGAAWECAACNRAFRLKFLGLLAGGLRHADHTEGGTA
jgi:transposase-like protein